MHCKNYWYLNLNNCSREQFERQGQFGLGAGEGGATRVEQSSFKMVKKSNFVHRVTCDVHVDCGTRQMLGQARVLQHVPVWNHPLAN